MVSVRVEGLDGRLIGVTQIQPGDDAEAASRKLLRDKHGKDGAFYDVINYPRPRWVI
jgi:hypothetical protein